MPAFAAEFHFDGVLATALRAPHKSASGQKGLRNEWNLAAPAKANKAYVRIRDWGTTVTVQTCVNRVGAWTMTVAIVQPALMRIVARYTARSITSSPLDTEPDARSRTKLIAHAASALGNTREKRAEETRTRMRQRIRVQPPARDTCGPS